MKKLKAPKDYFTGLYYSRMKGRRSVRGRGKRRVGRRGGGLRRKMAKQEWASCKVNHNLGYLTNAVPYKYSEFSLQGYERAARVASCYQFYRISRVDVKFIPTADTYIAGTTAGEIPNLYYMIDKSDALPPNFNVESLLQMGAKPIRFDDKTINVSFKPAVTWKALDENGSQANFGMTRVSPWLSTNNNNTSDTTNWIASSVDHHGIAFYVSGGVAGQNYVVEITAHFQFKKPLYELPEGIPVAVQLGNLTEPLPKTVLVAT